MRGKKRTDAAAAEVLPKSVNGPILSRQQQFCFEGESLSRFLESIKREIESLRTLNTDLPHKFWIKQQFAVGINEVTRVLERMPAHREAEFSSNELITTNQNHSKSLGVCLQAILVASDCNPRWLTKHLPALAASRNVPLVSIKDRKQGSLRLGELIKIRTAVAVGIKAKGNAINQLVKEALVQNNDTNGD